MGHDVCALPEAGKDSVAGCMPSSDFITVQQKLDNPDVELARICKQKSTQDMKETGVL
jgi:hypothetical protein